MQDPETDVVRAIFDWLSDEDGSWLQRFRCWPHHSGGQGLARESRFDAGLQPCRFRGQGLGRGGDNCAAQAGQIFLLGEREAVTAQSLQK